MAALRQIFALTRFVPLHRARCSSMSGLPTLPGMSPWHAWRSHGGDRRFAHRGRAGCGALDRTTHGARFSNPRESRHTPTRGSSDAADELAAPRHRGCDGCAAPIVVRHNGDTGVVSIAVVTFGHLARLLPSLIQGVASDSVSALWSRPMPYWCGSRRFGCAVVVRTRQPGRFTGDAQEPRGSTVRVTAARVVRAA